MARRTRSWAGFAFAGLAAVFAAGVAAMPSGAIAHAEAAVATA